MKLNFLTIKEKNRVGNYQVLFRLMMCSMMRLMKVCIVIDVNNRIDDNSNRIGELEPDVTSICSVVS